MPRLLLFLLLSGIAVGSMFAQSKTGQARLDSLLAELPRAKLDTNRVKLLYRISLMYMDNNPDEGINFANQSLVLARRFGWKKGMAFAHTILGNNYSSKFDFPQALTAHLSGSYLIEQHSFI